MVMQTDSAAELREKPRAVPGLETRTAGGEQLVHHPGTGHVHLLNATAGRVLTRCNGATSLAEIVDEIVASSDVDHDRAARDVISICSDFRKKGLIS
jgi:hypothetical protein